MKANSMSSYISKPLPLGSIVSINPESIGKGYANLKIDYVDISSVRSGTLNGTTVYEISKAPSRAKRLISHGDTILSTVRPNRRSFLFIKNPSPYMVVSTGFAVLRPSEKIDPRFLYYTVTNHPFTDYLTANAKGAAYPAVDTKIIARAEINLPSLPTQRKIASILSAYDDLIENNTRRIQNLEEMAQALYREWFVEFRFPGHEKVKMVESELRMVPEGWEKKSLPDLCSKVIDGTHDTPKPLDKGYYLVTGKHIINGFIDFSNCYFISKDEHEKVMKRSKPEKGDIIFSNIGTLGSTALVDQDFEFSIKNVALFKPSKKFYSGFLYLYFSSSDILEEMKKKASGTSQKFFSLNFLRNLNLITPNERIVSLFDKTIRPILEQRSLLNKKNLNLCRTRDLLLPKLISGEVDVSSLDIPTGEPKQ